MPRPLWKGSISFGLVNIPVTLHRATASSGLRFRQIDRRSKSPVREKRVSERTGQEVPWEDVVKGYEYEDGRVVLLEDAELQQANVRATQTIDIVQFTRADEIDPLYFEMPYYLLPGKGGAKGYALLRETLRKTGRVGIAKVVIRFRQHVAAVLPRGKLLVLELLRYGHELRDAGELEPAEEDPAVAAVNPREVAMAEMLVESMEEPWRPEAFHDEYRDAVLKLIEQKVSGGGGERIETPPAVEASAGADVIDIMALLRRSVERAGGAPGEGVVGGARRGARGTKADSEGRGRRRSTSPSASAAERSTGARRRRA
jgi:DNA end-binding protein Ku